MDQATLIAVGCTLHRLVAKCAGSKVMKKMGELLFPKQLGCGIKRGIEIAFCASLSIKPTP